MQEHGHEYDIYQSNMRNKVACSDSYIYRSLGYEMVYPVFHPEFRRGMAPPIIEDTKSCKRGTQLTG